MRASDSSATLTDFLQHSGRVLSEVEQGEIHLRRREGDDLVLLTRRHWEALSESFFAVAEAYRQVQVDPKSDDDYAPMRFALPWMSLLTSEDQTECIEDVSRATIAALQLGKLSELVTLLARWKATALATWDDANKLDRPDYWIDEPQPLHRP
jgi:hypothetical protein